MDEQENNPDFEKSNNGQDVYPSHRSNRFESAYTLHRRGISCVIWGEDALQRYGSQTVHFDLFLLVADLQAAIQCLSVEDYSSALSNPRYEWIPELYALPRFKKGPFLEVEDDNATYVVLIQASQVYYALPPADTTATASISDDDLLPPLPAFIDSIIDAWLDATTTPYASYLACYLGYLHQCSPRARDPLLISELKAGHRHIYRSFLIHPGIGARRIEWKELRDSVAPCKAKTIDHSRGVEEIRHLSPHRDPLLLGSKSESESKKNERENESESKYKTEIEN